MSTSVQIGSLTKTRLLVISDTHGLEFTAENRPRQHVDVVIHCGDLTEESKLHEFRSAVRLLSSLDAPLKLVIAGNHDFTLDTPMFQNKLAEARQPLEPELVTTTYGSFGEARSLLDQAKEAGVIFLDEGTHQFTLENGASLTVFASPYTPSLGDWGFQYRPQDHHEFSIKDGTDVAITHGPPKGIMDMTSSRERAGCPGLFAAIARIRPRLHCFGHIHEGWGAKMVTWREKISDTPSHFTEIDNDKSSVIENLTSLNRSKFDTDQMAEEKAKKVASYTATKVCHASLRTRDDQQGKQTLFVNAAIEGGEKKPMHFPWLIDMELDRARDNLVRSISGAPPTPPPTSTKDKRKFQSEKEDAVALSKRRKSSSQ
jgi:predicted phosphodiesterase